MTRPTSIPQPIWETLSTEAQAVVAGVIAQLEQRIADLEERLNQNSTNSSKPPSSDPPAVKRRPPATPSSKRRGGQPGHRRHTRALVPPEQVHEVLDCKPPHCRLEYLIAYHEAHLLGLPAPSLLPKEAVGNSAA